MLDKSERLDGVLLGFSWRDEPTTPHERYMALREVRQKESVARDHLGHRPPGVGRVFSKFVLGSSDGKGGSA